MRSGTFLIPSLVRRWNAGGLRSVAHVGERVGGGLDVQVALVRDCHVPVRDLLVITQAESSRLCNLPSDACDSWCVLEYSTGSRLVTTYTNLFLLDLAHLRFRSAAVVLGREPILPFPVRFYDMQPPD